MLNSRQNKNTLENFDIAISSSNVASQWRLNIK